MPSLRTEFPGSQGAMLAARLDTPPTAARAWAVFAHCFTCSKDTKAAAYIARVGRIGIRHSSFPFHRARRQRGRLLQYALQLQRRRFGAAANWLRARHGAPVLLIGYSLGGAAVLAAAQRIADARAVVTLGAPFDPSHVAHQIGDDLQVIAEQGQAKVTLGGQKFTIKRSFLDDLSGQT